jgi:dTDP-4-amino-4,6-dideoxygalactose transaminase
MDEIQCAILLKKLQLIPVQFSRRIEMKAMYDSVLIESKFWTPVWREGAMPHLYPIMTENRAKTVATLAEKGIETAIHYSFHLMEAIEGCPGAGELFQAKMYINKIISLPFNPWMTNDEINYLLTTIKAIK